MKFTKQTRDANSLDNDLSAETLESASVVNDKSLKIILINGEYSRELSDLEVTRSAPNSVH